MSSELRERIAKTMAEKRRELISKPLANIWDELALAALKAVREPTQGMIDAAYAAHDAYEADPTPKSWCGLSSAFRAMFDHEIKLAEGGQDE